MKIKVRKMMSVMVCVLMIATIFTIMTQINVSAVPEPRIWYVGKNHESPPPDFDNMGDAIGGASPGDTILVYSGVFTENIYVDKQLEIRSLGGPEATIFDGGGSGTVVTFGQGLDARTVLDGFTIQNGVAQWEDGGGILCVDTAPTIQNNIMRNNWAPFGGGISALWCSPTIRNNVFSNNEALIAGGGIGMYGGSRPLIENNIIEHNGGGVAGGGIECWQDCSPTIQYNKIANNTAGVFAAAIVLCANSNPLVYENIIEYNHCDYHGGGIGIDTNCTPRIINTTLRFNSAEVLCGGGKSCFGSDPIFEGCSIYSNEPEGLLIEYSSTATVTNCDISNNGGDGIYFRYSSTADIQYCNIVDNEGFGIRNTDPTITTVNAEKNWWGDPSGPGGYGPGTGDEVSDGVNYDPWFTGSIGSPRMLKEDVMFDLEDELTGDKRADKSINDVLKHLKDSLEEELWIDDTNLEPQHGHKVFDSEKQAIKNLQSLIADEDVSASTKTTCEDAINKLVSSDELLVQVVLETAKTYSGTNQQVDHQIELAEQELLDGNYMVSEGKPDKAIDHYKKAWKHAQLAIELANK